MAEGKLPQTQEGLIAKRVALCEEREALRQRLQQIEEELLHLDQDMPSDVLGVLTPTGELKKHHAMSIETASSRSLAEILSEFLEKLCLVSSSIKHLYALMDSDAGLKEINKAVFETLKVSDVKFRSVFFDELDELTFQPLTLGEKGLRIVMNSVSWIKHSNLQAALEELNACHYEHPFEDEGQIQLLTDADDTLYSSRGWGIFKIKGRRKGLFHGFLAGKDKSFVFGQLYPGAAAFLQSASSRHPETISSSSGSPLPCVTGILTARPADLASKIPREPPFVVLQEQGMKLLLLASPVGFREGAKTLIGTRKAPGTDGKLAADKCDNANVLNLIRPMDVHVFIGDNGQQDVPAGRKGLESGAFDFVLIHRIWRPSATNAWNIDGWREDTSNADEVKLKYFDTYPEAAFKLHTFLQNSGLACRSFDQDSVEQIAVESIKTCVEQANTLLEAGVTLHRLPKYLMHCFHLCNWIRYELKSLTPDPAFVHFFGSLDNVGAMIQQESLEEAEEEEKEIEVIVQEELRDLKKDELDDD